MLYGLVNSVILKRGNLRFNSVLKDSKSSTRPVTTHCFTEFAFATEMVFCEDDNKLGNLVVFALLAVNLWPSEKRVPTFQICWIC